MDWAEPHWTEPIIARLKMRYPAWDVWVIHRVLGGETWCAQLRDKTAPPIRAESHQQLAVALLNHHRR